MMKLESSRLQDMVANGKQRWISDLPKPSHFLSLLLPLLAFDFLLWIALRLFIADDSFLNNATQRSTLLPSNTRLLDLTVT
jgi:hypothetical protein